MPRHRRAGERAEITGAGHAGWTPGGARILEAQRLAGGGVW